MTTKVKSYRINITDDVQEGDAIVIGQDGGMVSCHLGTVSSLDTGTTEGTVPVLGIDGKLPDSVSPSSTMKKCIYDPNNKNTNVFDYCNLDNKPTIPVVNDPVVTFTQGGVTVGSISLNQAGPTTIGLLSGGVTSGDGITIAGNNVSVSYDSNSLGIDTCNKLNVKNYDTIASGAAAGATAVQADDLATVAMTGNYCDLINKPEIPSAQIQSDWEQCNTSLPDYIKNKPTIGNATITLQKNGTNVDCFELNQTANKCLNLTLDKCDVGLSNVDNTSDVDKPISDATQCALNCKQDNISDLNTIRCDACAGKAASETIANYGDIVSHNVCEFATASQGAKADTALQCSDLNAVAFSGKYCDLSGTPTIPTDNCQLGNGCGYTTCTGTLVSSDLHPYAKSCTLCTVATSGKYCDLTGQPTIPTDNCQLANSCGYTTCTGTLVSGDLAPYAKCCDLKTVATSGQYCDLSGKPTIPTDNCQLANSCGYITNAVNDLTNYYLKCETYKKCEVDNLISNFGGFEVVSVLPTTGIKTNIIYLLGPIGTGADKYEEWIYYNNTWTKIGETTTDLSNYAKCCDIPTNNNQLSNGCGYTTCTGTLVSSDLQPYAKSCDLCTVATSGKYCDLSGTPTIPTDNCQLGNSCGYTTCTGTLVANDLQPYAKTCTLCTIATSGKYCDLTGTPTIPTDNCQLANSCGYTTCTGTLVSSDLAPYAKSCDLKAVATSGKYCDLTGAPTLCTVATSGQYCDLSGTPTLCNVATTGCYSDLSGTPSLATVATTGCYNDLTGKPTIPTDNCQLGNSCNYITKDVTNLTCYTPTASLATVATSGAYCDLTGAPTLSCVACSGCYDDLSGKPNLGVYQTTSNLVCSLVGADNTHYPSAKAVADALSSCGAGDMLKATYDPCNKNGNAFDYNNFINTPLLCSVATSGKYCDLTGTPTIPAALSAGNGISITSNCINVVCDNSSIKKNSSNQLYADFTGLATTSELNNKVSDEIFSSSWNSVTSIAPSKNAVYDKIASIDTAINGKMPGFSLNISHVTSGNPREVKFITINYGNMTQYGAAYFKLSATSCHPDGGGYNYMVDIYIGCTYQGVVKCDIIKYIQSSVDKYSPGYEGGGKYFGDVFYVVDTDAKKVYFYILGGQYTSSDFTPAVKIGNTSLTNVQQHSGTASYYDTGTKVWANGCGSLVAIKSDIPSKTSQLTNDSNYIDNTVNNLTNYTPSSNLATVATSGKYCDLTDAPIIPAQLTSGTGICIDSNKVNAQNLFIINEDDMCVTYTGEKGVEPYNTNYCYTNVCIDPNSGVKRIEGAQYMFNLNTKVATSECRNVRLKIGNGDYIPLMGTTAAIAGSSYFVKSSIRPFQYSTKYEACGALHMITDSNTTYSAMTQTEIDDGTSTTGRTITPTCLKYAIEHYSPTDNCQLSNGCGYITSDALSGYAQTCNLATVATSGCYCDLTGTPPVPTDNCQLANGCGYTTCTGNANDCCVVHLSGAETVVDGLKVFESNDDPTPNSGSVTTSLTLKGKNLKKGGTAGYKYTSIDFKDKDDTLVAKFSGLTTPDGWSGFMAGAGTDPTSTSGNLWLIADNATNSKLFLIPPTTGHNYGAVRYDFYKNNTVRLNNNQTINGTKTFCCEIVLPNKTSAATNCGTKPATEAQVYSVANSIPTDNCQLSNGCGYITSDALSGYAQTCNLATVATSGCYCDLTGTPTIPTNNNQLTNGCGYTTCTGTLTQSAISDSAFSSSWDGDTTHAPSKNAVYDVIGDIETLLAAL